mmetsp:Transcript_37674/g.93502  ORF Transcript_37674/g.93502 Transcript_37674/m.93502 type:complete len:200 (-) Transcript_37674:31-630(-)
MRDAVALSQLEQTRLLGCGLPRVQLGLLLRFLRRPASLQHAAVSAVKLHLAAQRIPRLLPHRALLCLGGGGGGHLRRLDRALAPAQSLRLVERHHGELPPEPGFGLVQPDLHVRMANRHRAAPRFHLAEEVDLEQEERRAGLRAVGLDVVRRGEEVCVRRRGARDACADRHRALRLLPRVRREDRDRHPASWLSSLQRR